MNNLSADLDIGMSWILKDPDHFNKLDVTDKYAAHWNLSKDDLDKNFLEWLYKLDLDIFWAEIFYCSSKGSIFRHVDEITPANCCKLNWVYDQDETWMNWYQLKPGVSLRKEDNTIGGFYFSCDDNECDFVHRARIGKPTMVNAGVPHDVKNPSDYPRWCVSIVPSFKNPANTRLAWEDGEKIFFRYLKNV
jgi:hypothetical protein